MMLISSAASSLQDALINNVTSASTDNPVSFWQYSWTETPSRHFTAASFLEVRNFFHEQRQYFCVAIHTCPRMQANTSMAWSSPIGWTRVLRVFGRVWNLIILINSFCRVSNAPLFYIKAKSHSFPCLCTLIWTLRTLWEHSQKFKITSQYKDRETLRQFVFDKDVGIQYYAFGNKRGTMRGGLRVLYF